FREHLASRRGAEDLRRALRRPWTELRRLPDAAELVAMRGIVIATCVLAQGASRIADSPDMCLGDDQVADGDLTSLSVSVPAAVDLIERSLLIARRAVCPAWSPCHPAAPVRRIEQIEAEGRHRTQRQPSQVLAVGRLRPLLEPGQQPGDAVAREPDLRTEAEVWIPLGGPATGRGATLQLLAQRPSEP